MYSVLNWCQQDGQKVYAVMDTSNGGIEVIKEDDLQLLSFAGLKMQTMSGEEVRFDGDTFVCNVSEYIPTPESEEDDYDDYDDYGDYEEGDSEGDLGEESEQSEDEVDDYGLDDYGSSEDLPEEYSDEEDSDDPYDIYGGDYGDDDVESGVASDVSKLYALLSEDQIMVLRRYYLWYSQRLFTDAQKDPTYGLKSKAAMIRKRQQLNQLRAGGDYRYAGFLDTGSRDAGYTCSLGHSLRYMHLAWDITVGDIETAFFGENYNADYEDVIASNNCIIFGIKCIGDFFEVDQACVDSLKRAQNESLKDMQLLYQIYTGQDVQAVKDSFKLMDEVLKITDKHDIKAKMFGDKEPTIPFSVSAFYHQFREVDLIPPKSLVQEIRSCLVGWTDGKKYFSNKWTGELRYPDKSFYERLKVIVRRKEYHGVVDRLWLRDKSIRTLYNLSGFNAIAAYVYLMFTYEICGYYKYTATKEGFSDEGGFNKAKVGRQFQYLYSRSIHNQIPGAGFNLETLDSLMQFATACIEAERKYNDSGADYKIPYFSSGSAHSVEFKFDIWRRSLLSPLPNLLKECMPDDAQRNKVYEVVRFVSDAVFESRDTVGTLMNTSTLNSHPALKSCVSGRQIDITAVTGVVTQLFTEYDQFFDTLKKFAIDKCRQDAEEYQQKIEEEERRKAEEQASRDAEKKEADSRVSSVKTMKGVTDYLLNADLSGVTDKKYDFAITKILQTLKKSGKEPSPRQFSYLVPLYEHVSGETYDGEGKPAEKVELSDRQDIKEAIDWVEFNPVRAKAIAEEVGVADYDKLVSILGSIKRYGKISERQMPYAESALAMFAESKK